MHKDTYTLPLSSSLFLSILSMEACVLDALMDAFMVPFIGQGPIF